MPRSLSDRRALDAIAALMNQKRHPNDLGARLLDLMEMKDHVRQTGRRVPWVRKKPFRKVPKAEQQLRTAVQRCLTAGYYLDQVSGIVLEMFTVPIAPAHDRPSRPDRISAQSPTRKAPRGR